MIALDKNYIWKIHNAVLKVLYYINMAFMNDNKAGNLRIK
jgi:hypothetical protein